MALVKRHSEVLVLLGSEDLPRFPRIPILVLSAPVVEHHQS